ncbi:hypothetical protein V2G26_001354 [Clonostachys chloroleuca]
MANERIVSGWWEYRRAAGHVDAAQRRRHMRIASMRGKAATAASVQVLRELQKGMEHQAVYRLDAVDVVVRKPPIGDGSIRPEECWRACGMLSALQRLRPTELPVSLHGDNDRESAELM